MPAESLTDNNADSVADFYIILFDAILAANPAPGHGREGYYFGENGHYLVYDLCKSVAVALAAHGVGTDEPTTFTEEEHKTVSDSEAGMGLCSKF